MAEYDKNEIQTLSRQSSVSTFSFLVLDNTDCWEKEKIEKDVLDCIAYTIWSNRNYCHINSCSMIHHIEKNECTFQIYMSLSSMTDIKGEKHGFLLSDAEEIKDIIREALFHPNSMYRYQLVSFDGMAFRNVETVFERNKETIHREETDYER